MERNGPLFPLYFLSAHLEQRVNEFFLLSGKFK